MEEMFPIIIIIVMDHLPITVTVSIAIMVLIMEALILQRALLNRAILPMPIILIFLMGVASVITGLTDLLRNDTSVKHFCSFFGMLIGAGLAIFVALGYFTFV